MSEATLVECLNLIHFLKRKKRASLKEMQERFGLSQERLMTLLESLSDIGVPPYGGGDYIQVVFDGQGGVRLGSTQHFRGPVKLSIKEMTALRLWLVATSAGDEPWKQVVRGLLEKIEDQAREGSGLSMDLKRIREVDRRSQTLTLLDKALYEKKIVKLEYFSMWRDELRTPQVSPLGLVDRQGVWVLVAEDQKDRLVKDYRIDRIRSIEITNEPCKALEGVDLDQHVQTPFQGAKDYPCVRVRARGPLRRELESIGKDLMVEGEALVGEVPVASVNWLTVWLLQHPEHLDLLDARGLSDSIKERCQRLKENC